MISLEKVQIYQPQQEKASQAAAFMLYIMREAFEETYVGNSGVHRFGGKVKPEHIRAATTSADPHNVERLAAKIADSQGGVTPDVHYFLAGDRKDTYGFAKFRQLGETTVELEEIDVLPRHWHCGVGSKLHLAGLMDSMPASVDLGEHRGQVVLNVVESNERARDWYKKLGYEYTGDSRKLHLFPGAPKQRQLEMEGDIGTVIASLNNKLVSLEK